jgi:hypothetical protein
MNCFPDAQAAGGLVHSSLSADEYRLLADLLLEHIETDPLRKDQLTPLAQRLFVLAVQADGLTNKAS